MSNQNSNSILLLPDEVLIFEVLPKLPIESLVNFCQINQRINDICKNDTLWQLKTYNDYPDKINNKPELLLWVDYYNQLYKFIPIYINGDIIGYRDKTDLINRDVNFNGLEIFLGDKNLKPIMIIQYPSNVIVKTANINDLPLIKRILMIRGTEYNQAIIARNICSDRSNKPIYGIFDNNGVFKITTNCHNIYVCDQLDRNKLLYYLEILGIQTDSNSTENLCELLKNGISNIGHIIVDLRINP